MRSMSSADQLMLDSLDTNLRSREGNTDFTRRQNAPANRGKFSAPMLNGRNP